MSTYAADPILQVKNTSVQFDSDRGVSRVLNDVTLDIERNEVIGVIGESGSGKSMFADSLLNAVVEPGVTTGEVIYHPEDREPVDILSLEGEALRRIRWEEISTVFQGAQDAFNPTRTIEKHFRETLKVHDYDMETGMDRAHQLLSDVYLEPERVLDSYAHELSGGMKQRTLIALSLLLEPNVLIMDEPTAALDLLMQRSIIRLLSELKQKYELTLIFITHDLPLVAAISDRLAVMYAFEFAEIGPAHDILANAAHPYTRALLNATPNLDAPVEEMQPIAGSSPDPVNIPTSCSFADRCPLAQEDCRQHNPPFHDVAEGHQAACYHWEEAIDELPSVTEPILEEH